jgi:hypothetical protein
MPTILPGIGRPQSLGVYSDGKAIHAVRLTTTMWGPRELERLSVPIEHDEPAAFHQLLHRLGSHGSDLRVVIGVPTDRCYFATRPVSLSGNVSPKVLLRESLRSTSFSVDRMIADTVTSRPDKRDIVGILACDQKYIEALCEPFIERHQNIIAAEPASSALLRLVSDGDHGKFHSRAVIRVFISQTHLLAVLVSGDKPIVWRTAPLAQGDEAATILATVRSLKTVAKPSGIDSGIDSVVVHGRRDLERLVDLDWVSQHVETSFRWVNSPSLDGEEVAYGLAMRAFDDQADGFNLARKFVKQPKLLEIFPWRELVACALILLIMLGLLYHRKAQVEAAADAAQIAANELVDADFPLSDLQRDRQDLEARVAAVRNFLDSRILWTAHFRELSKHLPDNIYLTSFDGDAEFQKKSGKVRSKRALVIKGAVLVSTSGLVPHEVDHLVDTIRQHPTITKEFPLVELADLKQFERVGDKQELALFTIVCLPKAAKKKA